MLLVALTLGDVVLHADEMSQRTGRVEDRNHVEIVGECGSILAVVAQQHSHFARLTNGLADPLNGDLLAVVTVQEAAVATKHLIGRVAGDLFECGVHIDDRIVVLASIGDEDAVAGGLHRAAQQPQVGLGAVPFADVEHAANHARGTSMRIAQQVPAVNDLGISPLVATEAVLLFPLADIRVDRPLQAFADACQVSRVHQRFPRLQRRRNILAGKPERGEKALAPPQRPAVDDQIVDGVAGCPRDQAEAFLAAALLVPGIQLLGQVTDHHQAGRASAKIDAAYEGGTAVPSTDAQIAKRCLTCTSLIP